MPGMGHVSWVTAVGASVSLATGPGTSTALAPGHAAGGGDGGAAQPLTPPTTGQVLCVCACVCVRVRACVCVRVRVHVLCQMQVLNASATRTYHRASVAVRHTARVACKCYLDRPYD